MVRQLYRLRDEVRKALSVWRSGNRLTISIQAMPVSSEQVRSQEMLETTIAISVSEARFRVVSVALVAMQR